MFQDAAKLSAKGWFSHPGGISAVIISLSQQIPGSLLLPSLAICPAQRFTWKGWTQYWTSCGNAWSGISKGTSGVKWFWTWQKDEILFSSQNTIYKKVTQASYHYNFLFFIPFTSSAFRTINMNSTFGILGSAMLTNTGVPLVDSTPLSSTVRTENWIALPGVNLDHQPQLLGVRSLQGAEWSASSCRLIIQ